jgi:hypothetical protein
MLYRLRRLEMMETDAAESSPENAPPANGKKKPKVPVAETPISDES